MDFAPPPPLTLDHAAILVRDLDASVAWYQRVLGLTHAFPGRWDGVPVVLVEPACRTGLALFPIDADTSTPERRSVVMVDHIAFRVPRAALDTWRAHLDRLEIGVETQEHGVCTSLYFSDPDGHRLELTGYREDP